VSLLEGIKLYPKAMAWSVLLSTAVVMEGYDVASLRTFYASPTFQKIVCSYYVQTDEFLLWYTSNG